MMARVLAPPCFEWFSYAEQKEKNTLIIMSLRYSSGNSRVIDDSSKF